MKIRLDPSAYSTKFHDIIHSWDRYIIAYGGRGSSKTDTFYLKYLLSLFEPYYFKLAYINQEGTNIRDQQYAGFKRVAKRVGLYDHLKFYDGDYRIVHPKGNMLVPKGMDDPEKTKGLDDITAIWWDEANKGSIEGFRALNELLRSPMAMYLQFAISFNPVSELSWLRSTFFHPEDRHALHPNYAGQALLHHSTYKDNDFLNQEEYLQTLLTSAAGNKNTIRVNIEGDWGLEENNDPWLYNFDEDKHVVDDIAFKVDYPVYLSFDFNRHPVSCIAAQHAPNIGAPGSFIHFIKEFTGDVQLTEMCQRIASTYPKSILYVTGDRTGKQGDIGFSDKHANYYKTIQSCLRLSDKQMEISGKNSLHSDSRLLCNAMLYNYPKVLISRKGCPILINDCHIARPDDKSSDPNKLKKDRDIYKMDVFDAFRYYFQSYFKTFAEKAYFSGKMVK
jgi:phage terminase large subunit